MILLHCACSMFVRYRWHSVHIQILYPQLQTYRKCRLTCFYHRLFGIFSGTTSVVSLISWCPPFCSICNPNLEYGSLSTDCQEANFDSINWLLGHFSVIWFRSSYNSLIFILWCHTDFESIISSTTLLVIFFMPNKHNHNWILRIAL